MTLVTAFYSTKSKLQTLDTGQKCTACKTKPSSANITLAILLYFTLITNYLYEQSHVCISHEPTDVCQKHCANGRPKEMYR